MIFFLDDKCFYYFLFVLVFSSISWNCTNESTDFKDHSPSKEEVLTDTLNSTNELSKPMIPDWGKYDTIYRSLGFVKLDEKIQGLKFDVRYATVNNFTGEKLYHNDHVYLPKRVAEKLKKAQQALQKIDTAYTLIVFDGTRPQSVQTKMWDLVKGTSKQRYVAAPGSGSLHNYGCAVDVGLAFHGKPIDMGSDFDVLDSISQPRYHSHMLLKGQLTEEQIANRQLLKNAMKQGGFHAILTEWWHFNAYHKDYVRSNFKLVK